MARSSEELDQVPCFVCKDGVLMEPNGNFVPCDTCGGTGKLSMNAICVCGLSCTTLIEGFYTCGDPICLAASKREDFFTPVAGHWGGWHEN